MRPMPSRGRTISQSSSAARRSTTRPSAASSARSGSAWTTGPSCAESGAGHDGRESRRAGGVRLRGGGAGTRGRAVRRPLGGGCGGLRERECGGVSAPCQCAVLAMGRCSLSRAHELSRARRLAYRRALLGGGRHQQRSHHAAHARRAPSAPLGRGAGGRTVAMPMSPAGKHRGAQAAVAGRAPPSTGVQTAQVTADEAGMRVDRFLEARFPGLSFSHIQRIIRKGELRVNGRRAQPKQRLEAGQAVRIPPLRLEQERPRTPAGEAEAKTRDFLKSLTLYEDADVLVLNKPMGLAVQGGSGTTRHLDGMLEVLRDAQGQRPRLVHRLDKDTAGCLLVAKTRFAAAALAKSFRSRSARKIYWALVAGVPKPRQGRISTFLAKEEREDDSFMRIARHGEEGASHAVTYYAVVDIAARQLAWLSLKPVTGRTHQLRAHMAHIGHPIVGDPNTIAEETWELPVGVQSPIPM